jgi:trans-aconitate 2-methyltransferase
MTEWDAAAYAKMSGLQKAMAAQVLPLLEMRGDEHVLDVGCGEGRITALIASRVPRGEVLGVDSSRDMIAFASSHFGGGARSNLRFEVADARALGFTDAFDTIVSFNALHWVPDPDPALRSIRTALKPGGRAQLRMVTAGPRQSLESVVEDVRQSPRWRDHFTGFSDPYLRLTAEQYVAAAARSGLRAGRVQTRDETWDFESRDAFHAFCAVGLVAWTQHLPEAERPVFVDDVLAGYRAVTGDAAGTETTFRFYQTDFTLVPSGP